MQDDTTDTVDCDDVRGDDDHIEMESLLSRHASYTKEATLNRLSSHDVDMETGSHRLSFPHLLSRLQPSKLLYFDVLLSPSASYIVILVIIALYALIVLRYMYLRYVNQPSDIVAYLMIHILLQLGVEMYSKISFMYLRGEDVLSYQRLQVTFGWKSVCLLVALGFICIMTVWGTIHDFPDQYTSDALDIMIVWRFFLALFCWVMANQNSYQASLYYENFFIRHVSPCIHLSSTLDIKNNNNDNNDFDISVSSHDRRSGPTIDVLQKSSKEAIIQRIKVLMPTFVSLYQILTAKSIFNVINSAIFFILSIGFIGHSQDNGMFYYNVFMIMVMSIISYTSFETITQFNKVMDLIESATNLKLHLHVRVSSYAVDDRFLTLTSGAALLQVVLKSFGVS
jgi:hypothetical protein